MTQKLYQDMSAEEQAAWVADFAQVMEQYGERIALLAKGKTTTVSAGSPAGNITTDDAAMIRRIFTLIAAWPFAQDFCEKAQRYGDYMARTSRLPVYIEKVKEKLAEGLTMTDQDGNVVAYVNPSTPMRRRGRPTKEEVAARLRGETDNGQVADDVEARKRRTIAAMLGLQVVVHGDAPREKNNAELKAERDARKAEYEKQNPSLFGQDNPPARVAQGASVTSAPGVAAQEVTNPAKAVEGGGDDRSSVAAEAVSPCAQLMSDSYEMRMAQDKLHLNQLAWMLSPELAKRTETVQSLRVTSESASERAKTMADMGAKPEDVEPYSQQAKEATEAYLAIYAEVDNELAILHKRLYLDLPFIEKFKARFKGVDIEKVQYITRPYYEKVKSPELDLRIRTIIEQENPEYAAKMKAEQAKKEELQQLHRYIMRTDKPASDERVKTMTERIERVRQLAGDEVANSYLPVLEKTKEENAALNKAKAEKKAADGKPADTAEAKPRPTKQGKKSAKQESNKPTKAQSKAASKREQGDADIDHTEREQARRDNGKKGAKGNKGETPNSNEQPAAETINP